jgi:F-type H+-transporting ATPase subunit b
MATILDQLEINVTFFYQFILFGVFFILLSAIYLKPFQKLLERRHHKLKNDVDGAKALIQVVEGRLADYERELARARAESLRNYEAALNTVRSKEELAITAIKDELKSDFAKASQQLQAQKQQVESELKNQVNQMADALAQKALSGK